MTVYGISKSGLRQRTPTNDSVLVRQSDIDKHMKHSLQYLDNLKKQLRFHATKASSIRLRKEWLEKQKKMNYQNEYDRIRSLISQNTVKGKSLASLEERKEKLEKLGAIAVDTISH